LSAIHKLNANHASGELTDSNKRKSLRTSWMVGGSEMRCSTKLWPEIKERAGASCFKAA
jgi:hypothetical protein